MPKGAWTPYQIKDENFIKKFVLDFFCTFQYPPKVAIGRRNGGLAAFAGLMYWFMFFMAGVMYLLVFQIIMNNAHLQYYAPMGSLKLSLMRPTVLDPDTGIPCNPQSKGCLNAFDDVTTLPYCDRSSKEYDSVGTKRPCRLWDENTVVARNYGGEMLITTRVKEQDQTRICDGSEKKDTSCPQTFATEDRAEYYTASIEDFSLVIAHSMRTPDFVPEMDMHSRSHGLEVCVSALEDPPEPKEETPPKEEAAPKRMLLAAKAKAAYKKMMARVKKMVRTTKCDMFKGHGHLYTELLGGDYDVFRLGTIFDLHGISLDEPAPGQFKTRRESGSCFILTIHYWNAEPWTSFLSAFFDPLPVKYKYHLQEIPVSEFSVRDSYYQNGWSGADRVTVQKAGIRMIVMMTGEVGKWSFVALLTLAAAASTTIFMVEKVIYFGVKFFPFDNMLTDGPDGEKVDFRGAFVQEFPVVTEWWDKQQVYAPLPTTIAAPAK